MTRSTLKLVGHLLMEQPTLPPLPWPRGYVFAKNGVFAWARREGLEALIPVSSCTITGLYPVKPYVRLEYPPVDAWMLSEALRISQEARTPQGGYLEVLFYLERNQQGWQMTVPTQQQEAFRVLPLLSDSDEQALYTNTLIEVHSHHTMRAFFSRTDDRDEQGFRIYGVLGCVDGKRDFPPEIRVRVGIYGHFWEIPASTVFSLPRDITDCVTHEQECALETGTDEDVLLEGKYYGA
jgi:PRTRC genetic system protein A